MSEFRFCLEASALHDEDSAGLTDAIERYVGAGMPVARAQLAAITDVIADVRGEREQIRTAVREQHPQIVKPPVQVQPPEPAPVAPVETAPEVALRRGAQIAGTEHQPPEIHQQVSDLTRDWLRKPDVHVIGSMDEAPEPVRRIWEQQNSQGAYGAVEGFHWKGGVYLVGDTLESPQDVQRVLYHEALGHFGLRGVFGDRLTGILDQVAQAVPDALQEKARQYGADLNDPQQRRIAAEEVLAELAQTRPELGVVQHAVAAIRTFLREHGIDSLRMTQDEIIRNYILPARGFVERGRSPLPGFATTAGRVAFSRQEPFYSALARGISMIPAKAQGGDGWRAQIKGIVDKGVAKADEVEWSGLNDWLRAQTGRVSKQQVLDYLAHNGVQVKETMLGTNSLRAVRNQYAQEMRAQGVPETKIKNYLNAMENFARDVGHDPAVKDAGFEALRPAIDEGRLTGNEIHDAISAPDGDTKYGSYTLPGGTNYRELLLTLPQKERPSTRFEVIGQGPYVPLRDTKTGQDVSHGTYGAMTSEAMKRNAREVGGAEPYKSGHWDEPNVLAHVRLNDRTDADGKRTLLIEELQSDWAQQGRKQGFRDADQAAKLRAQADALRSKLDVTTEEGRAAFAERQRLKSEADDLEAASRVPRAPFVDSTDKWLPLALKRIIKLAADEGYDRVAFVNGGQSADRYDLSKHVDRIDYSAGEDGGWNLSAIKGGREVLAKEGIPLSEVEALVGKEIAQKMAEGKGSQAASAGGDYRSLTGLDLKVGGQGMHAFYDKIVPAAVNKLLPKLGGDRIGTVPIKQKIEDYERTARWVGPDRTIGDVRKMLDLANKGGASIHDNPLTGAREMFAINRVAVAGDLRHVLQDMEHRKSFAEAMVHPDVSGSAAELFGGRIERFDAGHDTLYQPGFDITTAMRERTAQGVPMFSRKVAPGSEEERTAKLADRVGAGYHAYAGVERVPRESSGSIGDSIAKALIPAGRKDATVTAGIIRANLGEQAREREVAQQRLMEFAKRFDKMPVADNYKFIDAMERGIPLKDPEQARAAAALRKVLDERRDQVIALGKGNLENFNENYFPHIWKDKASASNFFTRRPLEGGKGFLKQRTYDYFSDGLKAGLEPVTTNPVELAMLKAREMDRYIYGQRIFQETKDAGVAKFVAFGAKAPDGWVKINDKIARVMQYSEAEKGMILRGEYYAPEQAATLINNHLSPGLSGVAAFDMVRKAGNMMNAVQLGLSAFHLGFTTLDAMISKAALGIKQASRGNVVKGAGNVLQALNPAQPLMNLYKGDRLLKAYLGNVNDPDLAPIVEALSQAGGRVKMDDVYRNAAANEFRQAVRKGNYGAAVLKVLPRVLDLINKPIFEYLVPRQKLGVFFDMAKDALEREPGMDLARKREVMGKLWDSVDNRMGELVYDNVFWNRALKDALQVSVRSVGWNLGTFREIGGGVKDVKDIRKLGGLSDRTAYIFGLTFIAAMGGMLTQYLYTGEGPREWKDLFFPRTGSTRPDGTEDRLSLPSYMKDIYEYGHDLRNFAKYGDDPFHTLENKLHPLISTMSQIFTNKDFFGGAIRSPGDTPTQQALDEANYLLKQMSPFSLRNYQQQAKLKGEEPSIAGYLSSPSMIGITPAPGYITKNDAQAESSQVNKMRESLVTKFREEMRDGADWGEIRQRAMDAGIRGQDLEYIRRSAVQRPPKRMKEFASH